MTPSEERLLSIQEAASFLNLSVYTLRNWVSGRKVPYIKLGRRVLFRKEDLALLAASHLIQPNY